MYHLILRDFKFFDSKYVFYTLLSWYLQGIWYVSNAEQIKKFLKSNIEMTKCLFMRIDSSILKFY